MEKSSLKEITLLKNNELDKCRKCVSVQLLDQFVLNKPQQPVNIWCFFNDKRNFSSLVDP